MRFVLAVAFAAAATTARGGDTVSEASFLAAAEGLAARALVEDVARAEAQRGRVALLANPRLEAGREQPDGNPRQTTWALSWSPPLDGRRGLSIDAADAGLRAAQARLDADRLSLRRGLRATYAAWALAVARAERLSPLALSVRAGAAKARRRADAGEMSGLAARRLELASAELEGELARAEAEALRTGAVARGYWPELPAEGRPLLPLLTSPPVTGFDGAGRRDVEALAEEARRAGFEARLAGRWLAGPELYGGWQTLSLAGTRVGGPVFGINWTVPLFDRAQPARAEWALRRDAAEARLKLARARARAEAAGTAAAYERLRGAAVQAESAAESGARVMEAAQASFEAGESSLTDLLDSLRAARDARLGALGLLGDALAAHRDLEAALGRPLTDGGDR
jgi:outer membrane protein TolC